jgi:hypothetical protein
MKIILIIVIIMIIFGFLVISNNHIKLNSVKNFMSFWNIYYNSLSNICQEGIKFTGKVINFFSNTKEH